MRTALIRFCRLLSPHVSPLWTGDNQPSSSKQHCITILPVPEYMIWKQVIQSFDSIWPVTSPIFDQLFQPFDAENERYRMFWFVPIRAEYRRGMSKGWTIDETPIIVLTRNGEKSVHLASYIGCDVFHHVQHIGCLCLVITFSKSVHRSYSLFMEGKMFRALVISTVIVAIAVSAVEQLLRIIGKWVSHRFLNDERHGIAWVWLRTVGDPLSKVYALKKFVDQVHLKVLFEFRDGDLCTIAPSLSGSISFCGSTTGLRVLWYGSLRRKLLRLRTRFVSCSSHRLYKSLFASILVPLVLPGI